MIRSFVHRLPALALRQVRRFGPARNGVVAVEFGLVALPFVGLLAAITETALAFFAAQMLDSTVSDAARQIYTGQFQNAMKSNSPALSAEETLKKFRELVCTNRVTIFDCDKLKIDILPVSDTGSFKPASPIDAQKQAWRTDFGTKYTKPEPSQIVLVQAAVEFPVFFSAMNPMTLTNGMRVLQTTVAFRTEPYQ
ncbi:MAG: pilus assembly protein [Methylobacterium sp.]|uniref:TadE/TadG family type IV pilus assembly protein n=1 Tax=Methylobacterium sp. TaxID=409 RepID=UPI0025870E15|nr:TadE/TadG family type IV pilus assembly protein [Methylobacterium sp.]MBY0296016.1 pilus assembly protein [Methylobacterium sp.]